MEDAAVGETEIEDTPPSSIRIYLSGIIASSLYISCGCIMAWTSPTFPKLRENGVLTEMEESWVGSLFSFGAAFGPIIIGIFNDRIGRKRTIYLLAGLIFASWLILTTSQNFYVICTSRIIGGGGLGGAFTGISIFVSEISDVKRRGTLGSFMGFFLSSGYLIQYTVGPYVSYIALILISWSMIVLFVCLFYFLPESPVYLIAFGQKDKGVEALCWYRGGLKPHEVQNEVETIEDSVIEGEKPKFWPTLKLMFTTRATIKGLAISLAMLSFQQLSAIVAIMAYAQDIFGMTEMEMHSEHCAMILGGCELVAAFPSPFLVRRFGLKPVLVVASFGAGISVVSHIQIRRSLWLACFANRLGQRLPQSYDIFPVLYVCFQGVLAIYFFLVYGKYEIVSKLDFLPITSLLAYILFFDNGFGPLSWAVTSEMFLPEVKSVAMPFCGVYSSLLGFVVLQVFPHFAHLVGIWIVFTGICFIAFVGAVVCLIFVPNTTGMTMTEIQDFLDSSRDKSSS